MLRPKPYWSGQRCRTPANCGPGRRLRRVSVSRPRLKAPGSFPIPRLIRRGEQASVFVATQGGFRLVPVTLLEEDQDHVVVSGAITDKDEVAVGGISALRGILLKLGAG